MTDVTIVILVGNEERHVARCLDKIASLEARQIRAMVKGMKDELRRFIANGGTIVEYGQRLVARQEAEIKYFNIAQKDLEVAIEEGKSEDEVLTLWERHNTSLRKMGIRTVPCPLPNRLDE